MRALVGHSGFVGTNLKRSAEFDALFNSRNIGEIRGCVFDTVVCAAAPANMWVANNNPEGDLVTIRCLLDHLRSARIGRLVLVSTIAVLDDASAGYNEINARYETNKAYGRNRRWFEEQVAASFEKVHVLRLPALYGEGIKKNFIFDLLNPVPSFLKPDKFESLIGAMAPPAAALARTFFVPVPLLGILRYERADAAEAGADAELVDAFEKAGFTARAFTNSESRFQYYDLAKLWADIDRCIEFGIGVLNVSSEPLSAAQVHRELTGTNFVNVPGTPYMENMHSVHADAWGRQGPYLYGATETLAALKSFYGSNRRV